MEIKNIINEVKNDYPKMNQITKKHVSNNIPSKWLKAGVFSLGITLIFKNNVFAFSSINDWTMDIAGGVTAPIHVPIFIRICDVACPIVQIVSAVLFGVSGLDILVTKIKSKKKSELKKVKRWIKVLFIISIILFILSVLTKIIINTLGY